MTVPPDAGEKGSYYSKIVDDQGNVIYNHPGCIADSLAIEYANIRDFDFAFRICGIKPECGPPYGFDFGECNRKVFEVILSYNLTLAVEYGVRGGSIPISLVKEYYNRFGEEKTLELCMPDGTERPISKSFYNLKNCITSVRYYVDHFDIEHSKELCRFIVTEGERFNRTIFSKISDLSAEEKDFLSLYDLNLDHYYTECMRPLKGGET